MNKKMLSKTIIFCLAILSTVSANAYYYQASFWSNGKQHLILLSDHHTIPPYNQAYYLQRIHAQRHDLLNFLASTDSFAIVEDLDDYSLELADKLDNLLDNPASYNPNNDLEFSLDELLPNLKTVTTPLIGLTQCCYALDIPVVDVDFRFFWINALSEDMTLKNAYDLCKNTLSEIDSYNDSLKLNSIYRTELSKIKPQFSTYAMFYNLAMRNGLPAKNINRLIDLKILHHINTNKKYNVIVVAAGGAHIARIEQLLPQLGFSQKYTRFAANGDMEDVLNLKNYFQPCLSAESSNLAV